MGLLILYERISGDWNKPGQSGVVDVSEVETIKPNLEARLSPCRTTSPLHPFQLEYRSKYL
jgi:hypothetical protein